MRFLCFMTFSIFHWGLVSFAIAKDGDPKEMIGKSLPNLKLEALNLKYSTTPENFLGKVLLLEFYDTR